MQSPFLRGGIPLGASSFLPGHHHPLLAAQLKNGDCIAPVKWAGVAPPPGVNDKRVG
jgi:hypothetical protein